MKKLLILLAGLTGMSLSLNASATAIANNQDGVTVTIGNSTDGTATNADCDLLTEDVSINLSSNVSAGYACVTATNVIAVGTCHPNGRKINTTGNYIYTGSSAGGSVGADDTNTTACDAAGSAAQSAATTAAGS